MNTNVSFAYAIGELLEVKIDGKWVPARVIEVRCNAENQTFLVEEPAGNALTLAAVTDLRRPGGSAAVPPPPAEAAPIPEAGTNTPAVDDAPTAEAGTPS